MKSNLPKFFQSLARLAGRGWFTALIALFAALDAFIFIIPIEALMVSAVFSQRKRWLSIPIWISIGSALGALGLAALVKLHGEAFILHWMPQVLHSTTWQKTEIWFKDSGNWALPLIALSPFPQQPAAALAGLLKMDLRIVFFGVLLGRAIKYIFIGWSVSYAPHLLKKFRLM